MKTAVLMVALLMGVACQADESPRQLFFDPAFIRDAKGAALHVNPPQQSEIVIRPDRPWEQLMISFFLTVRDEEGKLRMWYICRDKANHPNVAYAESTDGVTWTKPNLGIVEYEGSKENNLVGLASLEGVVFRDPNGSDQERYSYVTHLWTEGMVRFHSPDGLHWSRDAAPLIRFGADTQNVTFWDARLGRYVMYLRGWARESKQKFRRVVRAEMPNLATPLPIDATEESLRMWGKDKVAVIEDQLPTVFAVDDQDPPNCDVYNLSAQPYPLDPRWYVGFPSIFQRDKHMSDGRLEVQFTGSRDGVTWHRYDRAPYVALGLAGTENQNMTFMGTGLAVRGDEIWQYGTGLHTRHGDREGRKIKTDGAIYRHVQRVDGFVSLDFENGGGECRTAPVKIDGPKLLLNVDTGALGKLQVGVLDAAGKPIEGFAVADCEVLRINSTGVVVSWKAQPDLAALQNREVQLVFSGSRAKLFSFRFVQAN